jgi:hypothetical protein
MPRATRTTAVGARVSKVAGPPSDGGAEDRGRGDTASVAQLGAAASAAGLAGPGVSICGALYSRRRIIMHPGKPGAAWRNQGNAERVPRGSAGSALENARRVTGPFGCADLGRWVENHGLEWTPSRRRPGRKLGAADYPLDYIDVALPAVNMGRFRTFPTLRTSHSGVCCMLRALSPSSCGTGGGAGLQTRPRDAAVMAQRAASPTAKQ